MKRFITMISALSLAFFMVGCNNNSNTKSENPNQLYLLEEIRSQKPSNIDNVKFSNTKIIIPNVDEISDITFNKITDAEIVEQGILETVSDFTGKEADMNKMSMLYINKQTVDYSQELEYIPYNDIANNPERFKGDVCEFAYERPQPSLNFNFWGCHWYLTNTNNDIDVLSSTQIEENTTNIPTNIVEFTEDYINNDFIRYKDNIFDYKAESADIYKTDDNKDFYEVYLTTSYNGISFDNHHGNYVTSDEYGNDISSSKWGVDISFGVYSNNIQAISGLLDFLEPNFSEPHKEFISLNNACNTVSSKLTKGTVFNVDEIELMYSYEYIMPDEYYKVKNAASEDYVPLSIKSYPIWKFSILNSGIASSPQIYVIVNAISGEATIYR